MMMFPALTRLRSGIATITAIAALAWLPAHAADRPAREDRPKAPAVAADDASSSKTLDAEKLFDPGEVYGKDA